MQSLSHQQGGSEGLGGLEVAVTRLDEEEDEDEEEEEDCPFPGLGGEVEDSGLNRESDDPGAEGLEAGPLLLLVPPQEPRY
ncbi:hypothetical protein ABBQ38_008697 [Trebouxia sp. C0009 RCD-2024]